MLRRSILDLAILALAVAPALPAQTVIAPECPFPDPPVLADPAVPRDNVEGGWINFETGPLHAIEVDPEWGLLYAGNQPGARFSVFVPEPLDAASRPPFSWRIGPGVVNVRKRVGTFEVWLVDRVAGAVMVVDLLARTVVRTIRVGAEPHGLAFSPSGDRAWVTCTGTDEVDVIDLRPGSTRAYEVVNRIPVPAKNPRGIAVAGDRVYVAPFLSGNNTAPKTAGGNVADTEVAEVIPENGAAQRLPDRDLVVIRAAADPAADAVDATATVRGLGTILFNVSLRPDGAELWVPNTEALNAEFTGAKNFPAGQVVRNRISVVNVATGAASVIDLDALAPEGAGFAQPTDVAFDARRNRAYVCCYGSDTVAVIHAASRQLLGWHRVRSRGPWPAGPRTLAVDERRDRLYVFNKNDHSISSIPLAGAPATGALLAMPASAGYDPTPEPVKRGRGHLIAAGHSASRTSSCASCHVDGHTDLLAWNLGSFLDPEGTPSPHFAADDKGPMVTQSLRGLRESLPYHWRGEKAHLEDFNGAFVDLLERPAPLDDAAFAEFKAYMESLVYPPNPRQRADRSYRPQELEGARIFQSPAEGNCAACHALPLGTQNETIFELAGGPAFAFKVAQLRGVHDKLTPPFAAGGDFGRNGITTTLGAGLLHDGALPSGLDFLDHFFALDDCRERHVDAFLAALDTGLAPATAFAATLHPGNAATFWEMDWLIDQADRRNCDWYVFGALDYPGLGILHLGGAYEPGTGGIRLSMGAWGTMNARDLLLVAAAGYGHWTLTGVPVGMGFALGVDADGDRLQDWDELFLHGTGEEDPDSDGDGWPDGYEVAHGTDPLAITPAPFPDAAAPVVSGLEAVYATTNTVKIRARTSEPARLEAHWAYGNTGSTVPAVSPVAGGFDVTHTVVLQDLVSDVPVAVLVTATDIAGNVSPVQGVVVDMADLAQPQAARIEDLELDVAAGGPASGDGLALTATVTLGGRFGEPRPNHTVHAAVFVELDGELSVLNADAAVVTDESSRAILRMALPAAAASAATRTVHVSVFGIDSALSAPDPAAPDPPVHPYIESIDLISYASIGF